jgi:hypothetical protein
MRMKQRMSLCAFQKCCSSLAVAVVFVGLSCGGSSSKQSQAVSVGLPPPSPPAQNNSYLGTQGAGDTWQASINHTANGFTAEDLTNPSTGTAAGSIVEQLGFLELAQTNVSPPFQPFGFALEIPSRALLLRPGSNATSLAALVPGNCLDTNGTVTFQFVSFPSTKWAVSTDTAYGSVQASSSGTTWNFLGFSQFTLANSANKLSPVASTTLPW